MFSIGLTDHLEGPRDRPSAAVYGEVADLVCLADRLGVRYAWFSEHHDHAHQGHLPSPLLFALHLAGRTRRIGLGTAILCLNLHHPLDIAEQVAVADVLTGGRMAVGFGSGSTPGEFALFGQPETGEADRHRRFEEALAVIRAAWTGTVTGHDFADLHVPAHAPLPVPAKDLAQRSWLAVNSVGSAKIAGKFAFNMLFSHLRTPAQYREYSAAYRDAGGTGLVAANRPVFVGPDDDSAFALAGPALRALWRRFRAEGKIPAATPEPSDLEGLSAHPINFIVGGPESVARRLSDLHAATGFDVANVEVRWAGLSHSQVRDSLARLMEEVVPLLEADTVATPGQGPLVRASTDVPA